MGEGLGHVAAAASMRWWRGGFRLGGEVWCKEMAA